MKPALDAVREETSREICNGAKDFVAFALATGGDLRLLATACPCVTQGAPLGKAGLIFKQDQPLAPLGALVKRGQSTLPAFGTLGTFGTCHVPGPLQIDGLPLCSLAQSVASARCPSSPRS